MTSIKKLFFIPVGLPGMGKTTFCHHLERTVSILSKQKSASSYKFKKISYDRILTQKLELFQKDHASVPFHEIIDIVRSQADLEYLKEIENLGRSNSPSKTNGPT